MNKCRNCGTFVPVEKAFCPNCSEPIEPEEAPNRATTSSSDMMATMRDDPENYQEMLLSLKKKPAAAAEKETPAPDPIPAQRAAPLGGNHVPQTSPNVMPPAKSNKSKLALVLGVVSFLILLFVILLVLKVI